MGIKKIVIKGAREHNLKNIDVEIPRDSFVVLTGISGSGKSSLAFDTLYAEGQRRYVESLSAYARQFLGQMEKPDVDYIEGLSPAISIDQKTTSKNPRSTVATVTEIYDYLRLLYARIGIPHCHVCGKEIRQMTVDQMVDTVMAFGNGTRIQLLAPVIRGRKGEYIKLFEDIKKDGYVRVRIDGQMFEITDDIKLARNKKHTIEVVVDRLVVKDNIRQRLAGSLETVLELAGGLAIVDSGDKGEVMFSQNYSCTDCGVSIQELTPRMFSFNNPYGACQTCHGLGILMEIDSDLVIPNRSLPLSQGAIAVPGWNAANGDSIAGTYMEALAKHYGFSHDTPFKELSAEVVDAILYGTKGKKVKVYYTRDGEQKSYMASFEGIIPNMQRRYKETDSDWSRGSIEEFMGNNPCPACNGARLKPETLAVRVGGLNIDQVTSFYINEALDFLKALSLSEKHRMIANQVLKELCARLNFLIDVGLDYLTLSRAAGSLSGGEAQRIRLATQIGSSLVGVLYILDEPSIGLHQRDNGKLIRTLKGLRDLGNTVVVVEHDEDTVRAADHIVDIGPGAGVNGGKVVVSGTLDEVLKTPDSLTGQYLSGERRIEIPAERKSANGKFIEISGAKENNLKQIDVRLPLGMMVAVTGVSGSGKSSLVNEILYKSLAKELNNSSVKCGRHEGIKGLEHVDKVINIDQSPIGRTPRSNPVTYTGIFDTIRDVFAQTTDAKIKGYGKGRFSFNVRGGRCEACKGDGIIKIEMHFLPDVYVPCEVCQGKRYNRETLEVKYKNKNISDILDMTIDAGLEFFKNNPKIYRKMETLVDVGLGYIKLGQPSTTLSGGEAQRVKLSSELGKRSTGRTIYILDEPTTGLHVADVHKLVDILHRLTEGGNTVVVIEHNLDVIKTADYIIDLGPEGGNRGGEIVAQGTPEEVADNQISYTGSFLKQVFARGY